MVKLNEFWLTSEPIDFEHKKYLLLAYDQQQSKLFNEKKLYPQYEDILTNIKYVNEFLFNMHELERSATEVDMVDWLKQEIVYKSKITDRTFDEVRNIAEYSKDILTDLYVRYALLYSEIENLIQISGYRISMFDSSDGYLVVRFNQGKEKIYNYQLVKTLFPIPDFKLKMNKANMKEYYETRYQRNVYDMKIQIKHPIRESVLPVMKRKFLEHLLAY